MNSVNKFRSNCLPTSTPPTLLLRQSAQFSAGTRANGSEQNRVSPCRGCFKFTRTTRRRATPSVSSLSPAHKHGSSLMRLLRSGVSPATKTAQVPAALKPPPPPAPAPPSGLGRNGSTSQPFTRPSPPNGRKSHRWNIAHEAAKDMLVKTIVYVCVCVAFYHEKTMSSAATHRHISNAAVASSVSFSLASRKQTKNKTQTQRAVLAG